MLSGFRTVRREEVRVETGVTIRLDFSLAVGNVSETVTVAAETPALRATASLGQVVSEEKVVALPLNGRSFITLASLVPGVALPPGSQLPRINGGRPRTNEYLFDGISVLQPEPGQVAFFPIVDAIQEFKIETNSPPAEFGRFNGGVINLTTKAGTNALHGTAFEFFRHESLNARNFFQTANATKPEIPPQPVRRRPGRAAAAQSHVLLRRLSGAAAGHRAHGALDRADDGAAAGHLHAEHLRSGDHDVQRRRRVHAHAVPGQHDSARSDGPGGAVAAAAVSRADVSRHGEQLPAHGQRDRRPEPVGRAPRSSVRVRE